MVMEKGYCEPAQGRGIQGNQLSWDGAKHHLEAVYSGDTSYLYCLHTGYLDPLFPLCWHENAFWVEDFTD